MGWEVNKDILLRLNRGKNQVGLPKTERVRNIRGKYAVNLSREALAKWDKFPKSTIILFDDVATTGSTIKEAIKTIQKTCPERNRGIFGLIIAR